MIGMAPLDGLHVTDMILSVHTQKDFGAKDVLRIFPVHVLSTHVKMGVHVLKLKMEDLVVVVRPL